MPLVFFTFGRALRLAGTPSTPPLDSSHQITHGNRCRNRNGPPAEMVIVGRHPRDDAGFRSRRLLRRPRTASAYAPVCLLNSGVVLVVA
eukprot:1182248-Prorocentrum_minimum.AAC.2